jgi:hypothetical protein
MIVGVLQQALMITSFVLIMILLIEYINVQTRGVWHQVLKHNHFWQYLLIGLLGLYLLP